MAVPTVLNLPQVFIEPATFTEPHGLQQFALNIVVDPPVTTNVSFWVETLTTGYQVDLVPNATASVVGTIPFEYEGDDVFSFPYIRCFTIEAIKGVVTADYFGCYTIVDDEAIPILSAIATNVTAREGNSLKWTLQLSGPTSGLYLLFTAVKPTTGRELTSSDVAPFWLNSVGVSEIPTEPTPLSELRLFIEIPFEYGAQSVDLLIPLMADGVVEGNEIVALQQWGTGFGEVRTLTGNVIDSV